MFRYQRVKLDEEPQVSGCTRVCDDYNYGHLHEEMLKVVEMGDVTKIKAYLAGDFDVNARHDGETLLSRACATGQREVVALLLQCHDIHFNITFGEGTPLERAAHHGHGECVRMLLEARLKCRPKLKKGWKAITNMLQTEPQLSQDASIWILRWAAHTEHWEAVLLILRSNIYISGDILYPVTLIAIQRNRWDVVNEIFKRKFSNKSRILSEVLGITVRLRCWPRAQDTLQAMDKELKLEVNFVEAALNGRTSEVQKLLEEQRYDKKTLNACLLVVAAGGTNEAIARRLTSFQNTYSQRSFSDALFLAYLGRHSEMFSALLTNAEADYGFQDLCRSPEILKVMFPCDWIPLAKSFERVREKKVKESGLFSE